MMTTDQLPARELKTFLAHLDIFGDVRQRRAVIYEFGLDELRPHLDWAGSAAIFVDDLLAVLVDHGRETFDRFFEQLAVGDRVGGLDRRAELRRLLAAVDALPDTGWRLGFASTQLPLPEPPPRVSNFVGRSADLAIFRDKLATYHLAVITGMPGVGKTTLAAHLASEYDKPERVFWHSFLDGQGIHAFVNPLAAFLAWHGRDALWLYLKQMRETGGRPPQVGSVLAYLLELVRGGDFVLCLDDFHHVINDPSLNRLITRLREAVLVGDLTIIITSRRMPQFVRLVEFDALEGLTVEDIDALAKMRDVALTETQSTELQHLTGGNGLFVELALEALHSGQNADGLLGRMVATDDIHDYLLDNVNEWLTEQERQVMQAVAVLSGHPGDRDVLEVMLDGVNLFKPLRDLERRHLLLVQTTEEEDTYRQHDVVRAFYYEYTRRTKRQRLHQSAAVFYRDDQPDALLAGLHFQRAGNTADAAIMLAVDVWPTINKGCAHELAGVLAEVGAAHLEAVLALDVALALAQVWDFIGRNEDARASQDRAMTLLDTLPEGPERELRLAQICLGYGDMMVEENPAKAAEWLQRGLLHYEGDDTLLKASLHLKLGEALHKTGDFDDARNHVEKSLFLLPSEPSQLRLQALRELGLTAYYADELDEAERYTVEALAIGELLHDQFEMAGLWNNLGMFRFEQADRQAGIAALEKARDACEAIGGEKRLADIEFNLGHAYSEKGDTEGAMYHLRRSLELALKTGNELTVIRSHGELAEVYRQEAQLEQAREHARIAVQMALDQENALLQIVLLEVLAEVELDAGNLITAQNQVNQALELSRSMGLNSSVHHAMLLYLLGRIQAATGERQEACANFEQSVTILTDKDPIEAAIVQTTYGKLLLEIGQDEC